MGVLWFQGAWLLQLGWFQGVLFQLVLFQGVLFQLALCQGVLEFQYGLVLAHGVFQLLEKWGVLDQFDQGWLASKWLNPDWLYPKKGMLPGFQWPNDCGNGV